MVRKIAAALGIVILGGLILLGGLGFIVMRKNADAVEDAVNPERALPVAFDVWGRSSLCAKRGSWAKLRKVERCSSLRMEASQSQRRC
jgi:hypothetical protein